MRGGTPGTLSEESVAGFDARIVRKPDACVVNVFVIADDIVIDQEPVHTEPCMEKRIWWLLDRDSVYTFADRGITPKEPDLGFPDCRTVAAGKVATCKFASAGPGSKHRYSIHVLKDGARWKTLDPMMIND